MLGSLFVTIVAVACASSWSVELRRVAQPTRLAGLVVLCVLATWFAARRPRRPRPDPVVLLAVGAFFAIAMASVAWSVDPTESLVKAGAFGVLLAAAGALAFAVADDGSAARRLLTTVVAAAVAVALVGFGIWAVSADDALQPASAGIGARFRGLGENPNTVAMLFAAALPLAALLTLEARARRGRVAGAASLLLLMGSIAASGSRGALAAGCVGLLLFGIAAFTRQSSRVAVAVAVALLAALGLAARSLPEPLTPGAAKFAHSPQANTERFSVHDAQYAIRLEDEIGYPASFHAVSSGLFSSSGRVDAWRGALEQGERRPLAGYGFGTEEAVFVDRFWGFQGGVPENSFLGLFLQLGAVGVVLFIVLFGALLAAAVRVLRIDRNLASACLGVLGAGVVLSLVQSYLYAIGNVATLTVWICAFLAAGRSRGRPR